MLVKVIKGLSHAVLSNSCFNLVGAFYFFFRSRKKILEMVVAEEAVSEEVVAISDWAETLETFLQRKMKPIETRKQLREVNE